MTPIAKLVFFVTTLAPDSPLSCTGGVSMVARQTRTKQRHLEDRACVHPNAAGLDIGSEMIVVAVPPDRDNQPVRAFRTFTPDLHLLVDWLLECGIDTVALESTGVYWIAIYELLEQASITCYLVNAQHVKTVPGRNGFRSCTCSACFRPHFGPTPKFAPCDYSLAIELS